jgi:tRNA(Ile)-lysidine synthase TilS/MesJ
MAIEKHRMFAPEDKVGVMVSGGKDSAALLAILKKLYPEQRIYAIHLNLGIRYYSDFAEDAVKKLCEKLNVPLIVYNLKEKDGFSIDDFIFTNFKNKICSVCGAVKRYYFSKLAKENGINVICTAHHLDDVLSTMISIFFQGDFLGLSRLGPVIVPLFEGQAKKSKTSLLSSRKRCFCLQRHF